MAGRAAGSIRPAGPAFQPTKELCSRVLIMLEGLDRTGKTTLARAIADRVGAPVIHKGQPRSDWFVEYIAPLAGYGPGLDLVLDRWHWGELVWPAVFDRPGLMTPDDFHYTDRVMVRLGAVAILGAGDFELLWQDAVTHDEPICGLPGGRDRFAAADAAFRAIADMSALPVYEYDYRTTPLADAVTTVLSMAHTAQRTAAFNATAELERLMEIGVRFG